MKIIRHLLILMFVLFYFPATSQYIGSQRIDTATISNWIPKTLIEYQGAYYFGESEGESTLRIFNSGKEIVAQIQRGSWNDEGTDWVMTYENLTNVNIEKTGEFISEEYQGRFVRHNNGDSLAKCLKVYNSWSGVTESQYEYEVGCKYPLSWDDILYGDYTQASTQLLVADELKRLSSKELKIMRNEIFARYGYRFIPEGKMDKYFQRKEWYKPQHNDVVPFLTKIEKKNIQTIQKEEKLR